MTTATAVAVAAVCIGAIAIATRPRHNAPITDEWDAGLAELMRLYDEDDREAARRRYAQ